MVLASYSSTDYSTSFASEVPSESISAAHMFAARMSRYGVDVAVVRRSLYSTVDLSGVALSTKEVRAAIAVEAHSSCRDAEFMSSEHHSKEYSL